MLSIENILILIRYPIDLEIKNVCTPNINIATNPLKMATYLAPTIPIDVLKKTENGIPYFWEGLPIKFDKKITSNDAEIDPKKTIVIFIS